MPMQYIRKWSLFATETSGTGADLSALRCTFKVSKKDSQSPNEAEFTVFNIGTEYMATMKKSFTKVVVSAGYEDNFGLIFSGNIKGFEQSKENTETVLKFTCGDGDAEYNYSVINKTMAAGATADTVISELTGAMGLPTEYKSQLEQTALPRGKVLYGRPYEFMREQAVNTGCTWSIQDGKVLMLKRTELAPGTAVLLSADTGLIGVPKKTEDGVQGVCLLNPMLKIGSALKLESKIAPELDGEYRIIAIEHSGDTRGNEWYSRFTCLNMNQTGGADKVSKK